MGVTCGTHRGDGNVCSILVGKPEGERPLGRPKRRREDNTGKDFKEIGCEVVDWFSWLAVVNTVMNDRVP